MAHMSKHSRGGRLVLFQGGRTAHAQNPWGSSPRKATVAKAKQEEKLIKQAQGYSSLQGVLFEVGAALNLRLEQKAHVAIRRPVLQSDLRDFQWTPIWYMGNDGYVLGSRLGAHNTRGP